MSDEELDNIFKTAADDFSAEYDASGWKELSIKLNEPVGISRLGIKPILVILCSLLLIGTSSYYFFSGLPESSDIRDVQQSANILKKTDPESESQNTLQLDKSNPDRTTNIPTEPIADEPTNFGPRKELTVSQSPVTDDQKPSERLSIPASQHPAESDARMNNSGRVSNTSGFRLTNPVPTTIDSISLVTDAKHIVVDNSSSGAADQRTSQKHPGWISVKISVAPDFSSTELFNQGKPGINYGITTGFNFNEHWSVYSGVLLVRKNYTSTDISESYGTPGYQYPVNKLEGDCRMLDIPLNVYYSFHPHKSLSFKAGLGFSSYIMLQEDYTYYLDKPYGNAVYSQRIENENNEWFSMMNISIMMQKRISKKLFLEVEPFVKLPLAGIGEGGLSLYSVGGFVSLRYDFYK